MTRVRHRVQILSATVVLALGTAACGSDGGGTSATGKTQEITVQVFPGTMLSLPLYVAESKGMFAANGLKPNLTSVSNGASSTQQVISGGLDLMGNGVSNTLLAQSQLKKSGSSDRIVGVIQSESGLHYTVMGQGSISWPTQGDNAAMVKAFKGKTIGVTAVGADTQQIIEGMMRKYGEDPKGATFVAVGGGSSAIAAFEAKKVDVVVGWSPVQTILVGKGAKTLIDFPKGDGGPEFSPWTVYTYLGLLSNIEKNPDKFKRFQKVLIDATKFTKDPNNLDELAKIFKQGGASELSDQQIKDAIAAYQPLYSTTFDCKILANELKFYVNYVGNLKQSDGVTCDQYIWSEGIKYTSNG